MGLDARVRCRCWEDGLVAEPPIPRELIYVDEEDFLGVVSQCDDEQFSKFLHWEQNACAHKSFRYALERIGNAATVGGFLDALDRAGADHFPTLTAELGSGLTAPKLSARCLRELDFFVHHADLGAATTLFDDTSGTALRRHSSGGNDWFRAENPWRIGLDEDGFFVHRLVDGPIGDEPSDWRPGHTTPSRFAAASDRQQEVFRSRLFTQEIVKPGQNLRDRSLEAWTRPPHHTQPVTLRLNALDRQCEVTLALSRPVEAPLQELPDGKVGWDGREYPRRFRVEKAPIPPGTYAYIVDALTTVFRASVEARQPVVWC